MKRFFLSVLILSTAVAPLFAGGRQKSGKAAAVPASENEVHWLTLDEAQAAMQQRPKKVWIDVYTGWCSWCKVMDRKTFSNPMVAQYMNEHFYAIRFDAEQKDSVSFMGKKYGYLPDRNINQFALTLLQEQITYPSSVFMQENFQNPMPAFGGYLDVRTIEIILTYLAKEKYKTTPFDHYQREYVPGWSDAGPN